MGIRIQGNCVLCAGNNICNNPNTGIYVDMSEAITISGNTINNNGFGIQMWSVKNGIVSGNICIRGTGQASDYSSSQYTIYTNGSPNSNNLIVGNNIMGKNYVDNGTGNTWANNKFE